MSKTNTNNNNNNNKLNNWRNRNRTYNDSFEDYSFTIKLFTITIATDIIYLICSLIPSSEIDLK